MMIDGCYSGATNDYDDIDLMGVEDETEDILQGMDDEDILDDLENYPEIMGEYLPEIMGKRKRRGFLARLAARRRKKLRKRMKKMSPKRRARWERRIKRRKKIMKKLKRFKKIIPFLIPGSMTSKLIARRVIKRRRAGKRGLSKRGKAGVIAMMPGGIISKLIARKVLRKRAAKKRRLRSAKNRALRSSEIAPVAPLSVYQAPVQPVEVERELRPAISEVSPRQQYQAEDMEPVIAEKKGFDKKLLLPIAAAAIAIPLLMKKK